MDTNETLREEMDRWADLLVGLRDEHTNRLPAEYDRLAAGYGLQLALAWRRLNALPRPPADTSWVTMSDAGPELHMGQPSAATQPPLSPEQVGLAMQELVRAAFEARERRLAAQTQRTDWPATARKLMTAEGAREILEETEPTLFKLGHLPKRDGDV